MSVLRAGLIGANISRTRLPAALEILCAMTGWTLDFALIDTCDDPDFDLAGFVDTARRDGWSGVSVTHPHKTQGADYVGGRMDADMALLGAANLITFQPRLRGTNTDFTGAKALFRQSGVGPLGDVTMIGAGGVARALAPVIRAQQNHGAVLFVHDRDGDAARDLCDTIGKARIPIGVGALSSAIARSDGVVNATPIGMAEHPGSVFDPSDLVHPRWAFDAIYTPPETEFLREARLAGMTVISGFDLFRHMALDTFEIYTGQTPPDEAFARLAGLRPG
ncbi:MAG: shikimate dehydrogenase [Sedimentitalea sp.]